MTLSIEFTTGGWFEGLPKEQSEVIRELLKAGKTEDEIGELWFSRTGPISTAGFGARAPIQSFYANVKREFIAFICGDPKYEEERAKAVQIWNDQGKVGLVSTVALVVANFAGLAAGAVVPIIALLFSLVAKMGINAFCSTCKTDDLAI